MFGFELGSNLAPKVLTLSVFLGGRGDLVVWLLFPCFFWLLHALGIQLPSKKVLQGASQKVFGSLGMMSSLRLNHQQLVTEVLFFCNFGISSGVVLRSLCCRLSLEGGNCMKRF